MNQPGTEYSHNAGEWIVCKNETNKHDPRTATPYKIAVIGSDYTSFSRLNNELMKSGEVAYTRRSYEGYFTKRHNLDTLPKIKY